MESLGRNWLDWEAGGSIMQKMNASAFKVNEFVKAFNAQSGLVFYGQE